MHSLREFNPLEEEVKREIYKQFRQCAQSYKPIFSALSSNNLPKDFSAYLAEVTSFYDYLKPYVQEKTGKTKFEYLAIFKDDGLAPFPSIETTASDPHIIHRTLYANLDVNQTRDKQVLHERKRQLLTKFESVRQCLNRLAFDLKLIDAGREGFSGLGLRASENHGPQ